MRWNQTKPQKSLLKLGVWLLATSLSSQVAWGAKMRAMCYLVDKDKQAVQGVDVHHPYEIASVSKIFTSYWAVAVRGVNYRFQTKLYIRPVENGVVDMHIAGGWDPYFNREQFQYLLTQLSALKITRIRNLSFDENFKFLIDTRGAIVRNVPIGHYQLNDPSPQRVLSNMKQFAASPSTGYAQLRAKAKAVLGMDLPVALKVKIGSVGYLPWQDFRESGQFINNSRQMIFQSVTLDKILKEMNRNSNNYAANLIFESLGGADEFQKFINKALQTQNAEIRFVNGSGDRLDLANHKSAYNEASCDAIVKTISQFRTSLNQQGLELEDAMALDGDDPSSHEQSTVSKMYPSEAVKHAMIAKSGTVNPSVTLAGMALTEEGNVYFGYIYGTNGRKADWRSARLQIHTDVIKLFKKFGNKKEIDYDPTQFMPFDKGSHLYEANTKDAVLAEGREQKLFITSWSAPIPTPPDVTYSSVNGGKLP